MGIGGVVSAIVVGAVVGYVGRFIAPRRLRRGDLGMILTVIIGIVAAVLGTSAANGLDVHRWVAVFAIQLLFAALFVVGFAQLSRGRDRAR